MLIPQARIGIAQRRRPDFVLFVPLQHWKYRWYAIELDGRHIAERAQKDRDRNDYLNLHGYEVVTIATLHCYREVGTLVERIEHEMSIAASDRGSVAVNVEVVKVEAEDDDVPF
jgi:hypothetical protein